MGTGGKPPATYKLACVSNDGQEVTFTDEKTSLRLAPNDDADYFIVDRKYLVMFLPLPLDEK